MEVVAVSSANVHRDVSNMPPVRNDGLIAPTPQRVGPPHFLLTSVRRGVHMQEQRAEDDKMVRPVSAPVLGFNLSGLDSSTPPPVRVNNNIIGDSQFCHNANMSCLAHLMRLAELHGYEDLLEYVHIMAPALDATSPFSA
uniref:Uncharacterized protein n=1 Tax=Compsopogon caeruleus TaxID=31354 RepID=A0A6T6C7S6_9RHOD|mmetsp:Transcript_4675/g.9426  ORF Transcript_4675/g.9426 Transcript_4675/m.9426 type:complete len:140 (+) Transcript_4675:160-579(+)